MRRLLPTLLLLLAAGLYAWQAWGPWRRPVWRSRSARDFASYYYAVQVALDGGNPYSKAALSRAARRDGSRRAVHPFFYPPPYLLVFSWVRPLSLRAAYRAWYVAQHLFLLAVLLALWRWLPRRSTLLVLAVLAVTYSPVPDNDRMGQANLLVLAVTLWGLLAEERGRPWLGGALVGLAAMLKMSPALLLGWWALHRRWRPVLAAVLAALLLEAASFAVLGPGPQARFYFHVLPGFGAGNYNGLTVPILLPANHSIPSLWHELFPGGRTSLSPTARLLSRLTALLLLGGAAWALRLRPPDPLGRLLQLGVVVVLMLVLPVYTYEHHMVWLLLPYTAAAVAVAEGRLGRGWGLALLLAYAFQALPLAWLNALYPRLDALGGLRPWVYYPLREAKFAAALLVGAACLVAQARGAPGRPARGPAPARPATC